MLHPPELLEAARLLAPAEPEPPPSQGRLRRAISTAYYALFHAVLRTGARRFMGDGSGEQPGYALLYRGFSHSRMKAVCKGLDVPRLAPNLERKLRTQSVSQDLRDFARMFVALQDARHLADYDPHMPLTNADALAWIDQADLATQAFARVPASEQADVLALMLANVRD